MEPFRPFVDFTVYNMNLEKFDHSEKMEIVKILNNFIKISGKSQLMLNAIKIYSKSIFEALNEKDISLIRFPEYELQIYENDVVF